MKHWRNYIVCLLLVTLPVSLWAGVSVPRECAAASTSDQVTGPTQPESNDHAHHDMAKDQSGDSETQSFSAAMDSMQHNSSSAESCCEACITVCLASGFSAMNLAFASLQPAVLETHFTLVLATRFLPGPSYPSLYRPPISQI